jgi:acyl carrier protein
MQKPVAELLSRNSSLNPQELELAQLIVTTLNLETRPAEIDPEAPLYGAGLGLDSIDILEIALAVSKAYGIRLRSDDGNNQKIFSSLRSLNQHIQQFRAK